MSESEYRFTLVAMLGFLLVVIGIVVWAGTQPASLKMPEQCKGQVVCVLGGEP